MTLTAPPAPALHADTWWVRGRWPLLGAWLAVLATVHATIWAGQAWGWFPQGAHLLFSPSWGHLYARHPDLQIGPLSFVAVAPIVFGLPATAAEVVAVVLMSAAGLVVLAQVRALVPVRTARDERAFLVAGFCFLVLWAEVAVTFAHADDVLAILGTVLGLRLLRADRPLVAALLLALAADCKPWAVMFVPLLLLAPRGVRLRAAGVWTIALAAAWLPFWIADPGTRAVASFAIPNNLASSLRVFGVDAATTPPWARLAQVGLAVTLGLAAVLRQRGCAVLLVAVAARLLLDPGTWSYYDAELLAGAALCDLALFAAPVPVLSISAVTVFYLPMFVLHDRPHVYGVIRTAYLIAVVVAAVALPAGRREPTGPRPPCGEVRRR